MQLVDLMEMVAHLNSTTEIEELLALIMEAAKRVMKAEASSLMILDETTGELIISVPTGPVRAQLSDLRIPPGKGIAGWVATHGEALIVPDVSVDPRFYEEIDKISRFKTKSILCVPMKNVDGKIIGVLETINRFDDMPFNTQDLSLLSEFANQAAIAIENLRLYEEKVRELREIKETLARQDKLAVIGQLTGNICHELRNPIATISSAAYFLKKNLTEVDEETKQYLAIVDSSINLAEKIVKDLLDFAKVKLLERQKIHISELLANVLERLTIPNEVKIEQNIPPDLPEVFVDAIQLGQAFTNIITNAIEAMPRGGTLTICAESKEQNVCVSFTDTGCGIPEEDLPKIFEPLFTTKAQGTGFGLTVAQNLTEINYGTISVASKVGKGTTFTITLPTKV
jgi:signal transduction histidine kinase